MPTLTKSPQQIWKKLEGLEQEIHDLKQEMILKPGEVGLQPKKINWEAWKKAAGILRGRKIPDAVAWQRKIRKEWERPLS